MGSLFAVRVVDDPVMSLTGSRGDLVFVESKAMGSVSSLSLDERLPFVSPKLLQIAC